MEQERPAKKMAEDFLEVASAIRNAENGGEPLKLEQYCRACSSVTPCFDPFGPSIMVITADYLSKVNDLIEASELSPTLTLAELLDADIEANCVREDRSNTRNLLKTKRAIDFVIVLLEQLLASNDGTLSGPGYKAWETVYGQHHGQAIRRLLKYVMGFLPTRARMMKEMNETEASGAVQMKSFVESAALVSQYVDQHFIERKLGMDW